MNNSGGRICDFIYENKMTKNVSLVEIKTPTTPLLGSPYRGTGASPTTVYSLSKELSGAVNQVLGYRDSLTKEFNTLCRNSEEPFEAFGPECVVIAGNASTLNVPGGVATFENFRNSLNGVRIITYDELLLRIDDLINILRSTPSGLECVTQEPVDSPLISRFDNDIPF